MRKASGTSTVVRSLHEETTGHAQTHSQATGAPFDEGEFLAVPDDSIDGGAGHRVSAFGRLGRRYEVAPPHLDRLDHSSLEHLE